MRDAIAAGEPVGELFAALGLDPFRPAHRHVIVSIDSSEIFTAHIFDPDDPFIDSDPIIGVKESLIAEFRRVDYRARSSDAGFDFVPAKRAQ